MTNPTPHGQVPEALRLAHIFDNPLPPEWPDMVAAAAELRRQHTRIAELEAQIEALSGVQALSAAPGEPPGIRALMCVISSLRDTAHFSDEEGELTNDLRTLRDWAYAQTAAFQPSPTAQAAESVPALDRDRIREIFMAHGFTIKEGQTDLKQYVYDAADALIRAARAKWGTPQPVVREPELDQFLSDVMTAAGLVTHGKQCKQLGERLGAAVMKLRVHNIPQKGCD